MMFDKLCSLIERHDLLHSFITIIKKSCVFNFRGNWRDEFATVQLREDTMGKDGELFTLPFNVTAIEDDESLTIMKDLSEYEVKEYKKCIKKELIQYVDTHEGYQLNRGSKVVGFHGIFRLFMEFRKMPLVPDEITGKPYDWWYDGNSYRFRIFIFLGMVEGDRHRFLSHRVSEIFVSKRKIDNISNLLDEDLMKRELESIVQDATVFMDQVCYINIPARFVVEERPTPLKSKKNQKPRIKRTNERSTYTVLTPTEIRKTLGIGKGGEGGKKVPHQRRRHLRVLRSDRYKGMKGKTIVVNACWVGKRDVEFGGKKYIVRIDL